jgi:glutamate formiminotransferase
VHRVFELVRREAERHGCGIAGTEFAGLVPRKALEMAADYFLRVETSSSRQVLENRLAALDAEAPERISREDEGSRDASLAP